jgi:osmotically-inducible protein OsmY
VRAVANELTVEISGDHRRDDVDIVRAAEHILSWHSDLPKTIQVSVSNGWLTLSGAVRWYFEKEEAESSVRSVKGVSGVVNNIEVKNIPAISDVGGQIRERLERAVGLDANRIDVVTGEGQVALHGVVHSSHEADVVRKAAWSVPGVTSVEDHLVVA